jgi:hypothetical protein
VRGTGGSEKSGAGRMTSEWERSGERDVRKKGRGSGARSGRSGNGNGGVLEFGNCD